jgi:hypothetical protein
MTFEEWWGGERDRALAYDLMKVLTEAAKQAWHAGHVTSIEEMLEKWNRTGVDIDAALHGRVNEKSPIANRLRMIAAAQPRWQPIGGTKPIDGVSVLLLESRNGRIETGYWSTHWKDWCTGSGRAMAPDFSMPMPPLPEPPSATGEKEQEDRDVT